MAMGLYRSDTLRFLKHGSGHAMFKWVACFLKLTTVAILLYRFLSCWCLETLFHVSALQSCLFLHFSADQISCRSYVGSAYRLRSLAVSGFSLILDIHVMIDSCQSNVSADQYHVTISRAQVECFLVACFLKLTAEQALRFLLNRGLKPGYYSKG